MDPIHSQYNSLHSHLPTNNDRNFIAMSINIKINAVIVYYQVTWIISTLWVHLQFPSIVTPPCWVLQPDELHVSHGSLKVTSGVLVPLCCALTANKKAVHISITPLIIFNSHKTWRTVVVYNGLMLKGNCELFYRFSY